MSIVRQMSQLLLRGSLANVTMANLSSEQQRNIEVIIDKISSHPKMANHKARFIKELGGTIGADYRDDRSSAEEEFLIAIWRGAVDLVYHNKYRFSCRNCKKSSYVGQNGRSKEFDRLYPICPSCSCVEVVNSGDTSLIVGQFVTHEQYQNVYRQFTGDQATPECKTPISYHVICARFDNPQRILEDDSQLVKFFSEYLWNYFRQMLKENGRFEHQRSPQHIKGPGDEIILEEILSLCTRMKVEYHYSDDGQTKDEYIITITGLKTPPEFTVDFIDILRKASDNNIRILISDTSIVVKKNHNAPFLEAFINKPEHVLMFNGPSTSDDEEEGQSFTISQVSYKTIGAEQMNQPSHTSVIDNEDVISAIRSSLPEGECQQVFDIWSGRGQTFIEFTKQFGDKPACINHIARHMRITTRAVNQHKDTIRINMLAHGMLPNS